MGNKYTVKVISPTLPAPLKVTRHDNQIRIAISDGSEIWDVELSSDKFVRMVSTILTLDELEMAKRASWSNT